MLLGSALVGLGLVLAFIAGASCERRKACKRRAEADAIRARRGVGFRAIPPGLPANHTLKYNTVADAIRRATTVKG